jgi:hypothetical protein
VYELIKSNQIKSRAGVDSSVAFLMTSRKSTAQASRYDREGSCWYRSQRGRVSAEDVLRVLVNFSQLVFFQLRRASRAAVGRSGCWDITWKQMTSWLEPVPCSSLMAQFTFSFAIAGAASVTSSTDEPVPVLQCYVGTSGMLTRC